MDAKIKKLNLVYRKLKISDYHEFKKLFYNCFNRNISFDFFRWRYFRDKFSFCYGAFHSSSLIANVGMVSIKLNNKKKERIFSRHSSMVLKKYRRSGVFSDLLNRVKKKILNNVRIIVMWPNKNNFSNFSIERKKIIKKKFYLYQSDFNKKKEKKTHNYNVKKLIKLKKIIQNKESFFLKDFDYFKKRYLSYNQNEYFINKYSFKNLSSFFIIKINKNKSYLNYVILDHFGSSKIKSNHFSYLLGDLKKIVFLSKKKINKSNFKFLNHLYFKIGFINKFNTYQKKKIFSNKEIFLGDTDIFMKI